MSVLSMICIFTIAICIGQTLAEKKKFPVDPMKWVLRAIKSCRAFLWYDPKLKIAVSCLPEVYCYYEYADDPALYHACAIVVIECVFQEVTGISSCLYDIGSDVVINWYFHGDDWESYEWFEIVLDVLKCAGADEHIIKYVKKSLFG